MEVGGEKFQCSPNLHPPQCNVKHLQSLAVFPVVQHCKVFPGQDLVIKLCFPGVKQGKTERREMRCF
jgi:hypothetical protein